MKILQSRFLFLLKTNPNCMVRKGSVELQKGFRFHPRHRRNYENISFLKIDFFRFCKRGKKPRIVYLLKWDLLLTSF